ncbi:GntR family transcriptional regulator [Roseovarius sp. LXJ103]|uniref:GntR family transcriptional regulator n=1 Tax=Roseovarius carneus TaxID=2853164 RepID=UPI000D60C149|nr:GntR family transcriptional regulator [Roseovarius carneus]MBZ8119373.1 GntR family transcriptional regulator [Roseovarius carneus]PWE34980.1 GntR family transcriptional regulator [Pelagicola sp. LXJ1103]
MDTRRADSIAAALEEMILSGGAAQGDRLDEHSLAERFGVSRTPIREALQKLARTGLVEHIPHRGVFVHQPGPVELMEMFEVMAELEAAAGRLAALRISDAALSKLHAANIACQAAIDAQDTDAYYTSNETFHRMIYAQSGNSFLEAETLRLFKRLRPFRRLQLRLRGRMAQSMAEHEAILAALEAGRPTAAADALRAHVAVQGEKFHHLMASLRPAAE